MRVDPIHRARRLSPVSQRWLAALAVGALLCVPITAIAARPGQAPPNWHPPLLPSALTDQFYAETGLFALSVDGGGSNTTTAPLRVTKPNAAATVRKAFLLAASTGFSSFQIPDGALTLNGTPITWDSVVPSAISSYNHRADVTAIVKPVVDAASPGIVTFTAGEGANAFAIDGEALAVIFDDPTQTVAHSIVMLFGAQATTGDTFNITLAQPIDPLAPGAFADMGLGISFGYQDSENPPDQYSQITVNAQQLSYSAGGEDDCRDASADNGCLITVGGIGDSDANPPDPNSHGNGFRYDDELYTLLPFLTASTTSVAVFTQNGSSDDNIFFAYFDLSGAAIVGAGIVLGPATATNPVGTNHTVTATVVDAAGAPIPGATVTFNVLTGPNAGVTGNAVTNASGQASFTYTDSGGAGVDQIQASFNDGQQVHVSNIALKTWGAVGPTPTPTQPAEPIPALQGRGLYFFGLAVLAVGVFFLLSRRTGGV